MEQFKLKSIEELDIDFVAKTREQSAPKAADIPQHQEAAIEFSSNAQNTNTYFSEPAQNLNVEPTYTPHPEKQAKKPRPLVPIGQNNSGYSPVGAPKENQPEVPFIPSINYGEAEAAVDNNKKKSTGAFVGKIVSIVLLAATVVVFVLGCFVSIFLDNGGSNIGGLCFNTMSSDLDVAGVSPVSEGDLIISKKIEPADYAIGDMIAVPSASTDGCDIHIINSISNAGFEDAELTTTDITNSAQYFSTVMASSSYGVVNSYIPLLGKLLSFAIDNAILVCILFVLLAAFWCLLLVLLEKTNSKAPKDNTKAKKSKN